jgi:hypothetical protein
MKLIYFGFTLTMHCKNMYETVLSCVTTTHSTELLILSVPILALTVEWMSQGVILSLFAHGFNQFNLFS